MVAHQVEAVPMPGATGIGYVRKMNSHRFANALPLLAVLGSVTALGVGTSFAKQLLPQVGSLGTTALRVGFSALLLLALWRPWRWPLSRADASVTARHSQTKSAPAEIVL